MTQSAIVSSASSGARNRSAGVAFRDQILFIPWRAGPRTRTGPGAAGRRFLPGSALDRHSMYEYQDAQVAAGTPDTLRGRVP